MVVGEGPGEQEELWEEPFRGPAGQEAARMCHEAGLQWKNIAKANVLRQRPPNNRFELLCFSRKDLPGAQLLEVYRNKFLHPGLLPEVERLKNEIIMLKPNLIIAFGAVPMAILTGQIGIGKSRGTITPCTLVPGLKVLGTYHPSNVLRVWKNRVIVVADLIKARRESQFKSIRRPQRTVLIRPTIQDIRRFAVKARKAKLITLDIETVPRRGMITCIGFSLNSHHAIVIPFVSKGSPDYSYWSTLEAEVEAWKLVKEICENPVPKLGQNGLYDIQWLWWHNIRVHAYAEDTMLLHHALLPEMPKSLGFMGSVYTNEVSWKLWNSRNYGKTSKLEDL